MLRWEIVALMLVAACGDGVADPIRIAPSDAGTTSAPDGSASAAIDVPDTPHCAEAADWPAEYAEAEETLLKAINDQRADGIRCDGSDEDKHRQPFEVVPELRCSARLHSKDMFDGDYFGRENRQGDDFRDRIRATGLDFDDADESIEESDSSPGRVLALLLDDRDDCGNLSSSRLTAVGIGHYDKLWTLDFAEF